MNIPTRRTTLRGEASKARIMRCALSLFALRGYDAVRVDEIARKARCNKALLYYHFSSKKALYQAILYEVFNEMLMSMKPIFEQPLPPAEKLRRVFSVFVEKYYVKRDFLQLMVQEILTKFKNIPNSVKEMMKFFFYETQKIIIDGQREGTILEADQVLIFRFFIGSLVASILTKPIPEIMLKEAFNRINKTFETEKEIMLDILMRGIQND
jgi:AcrR family transcriptional regulator